MEEDYGSTEQLLPLPEAVEPIPPPAPSAHKGRPRRPPPAITPIQRDDQRSDIEVDMGSQNSVDEQDEENATDSMGNFDIDHVSFA